MHQKRLLLLATASLLRRNPTAWPQLRCFGLVGSENAWITGSSRSERPDDGVLPRLGTWARHDWGEGVASRYGDQDFRGNKSSNNII